MENPCAKGSKKVRRCRCIGGSQEDLKIQIREPQDAAAFFCLFQADTVLSAISSNRGVRIRGRYTPVTRSFHLGCKFRRIRRLFKAFFRSEVYARAKLYGPGSSFSFPGCTAALKLHPDFQKMKIGPSTSHKCTVYISFVVKKTVIHQNERRRFFRLL